MQSIRPWSEVEDWFQQTEEYRLKLVVFPDGGREATLTRLCKTHWRDEYSRQVEDSNRRRKGHQHHAQDERTPDERADDSKRSAARRARKMVRWHCKTTGADHMVTFTYRANMTDKDQLKRDWKAFCRLHKARYPEWNPIAVPERQQRGAWHLHVAVKGFQHVNHLRADWRRVVGADNGNIDVTSQRRRWGSKSARWDQSKLVGYLCGYVAKSFEDQDAFQRRYWPTRDLDIPSPVTRYVDAECWTDAIERVYRIVAADQVEGVSHWLDKASTHYWIANAGAPDCPF